MNTQDLVLKQVAEAIAHHEGFYKKSGRIPEIAVRLNNPGCLTHWKNKRGVPYPVVNGYVQFPDVETGWEALISQCRINVVKRELTFKQFFAGKKRVYEGYSPRNSPLPYAAWVLNFLRHRLVVPEWATIDTPIVLLICENTNS